MKTSIEWTDETWGPVVGCTRKSPGCEHCYAETMAARQVLMTAGRDAKALAAGKPVGAPSVYLPVVDAQRRRWNRKVELLPDRLLDPLGYRPGSRVFVCSMSDLFHAGVPFDYIRQVWGVMASTPAVTYQVLTKRPERAVEFLAWLEREGLPCGVGTHMLTLEAHSALDDGPLRNVWLGTSVEDQKRADERVPLLLEAPASIRFLSCEPLLGPLDLGRWIGNYNCHPCGARFWGDEANDAGRDLVTVDFEQDPEYPDDPDRTRDVCPRCGHPDLGTGDVGPASSGEYEGEPTIDWLIAGGESGPHARPMDAGWVRSLRDQCRIAELLDEGREVAFFFKQWGGPNKKRTGRVLDGRTHDAMPEVRYAC